MIGIIIAALRVDYPNFDSETADARGAPGGARR
jgi:hypothetical protein